MTVRLLSLWGEWRRNTWGIDWTLSFWACICRVVRRIRRDGSSRLERKMTSSVRAWVMISRTDSSMTPKRYHISLPILINRSFQYDELIPSTMDTEKGGFYINKVNIHCRFTETRIFSGKAGVQDDRRRFLWFVFIWRWVREETEEGCFERERKRKGNCRKDKW